MVVRLVAWLCVALALTGCMTYPRAPAPLRPIDVAPSGLTDVRLRSSEPALLERLQANIESAWPHTGEAEHPIAMLALSGGGAEGAFGAGVLVGWTRSGDRPEFQVVTGVSTGALIAPFAFLGSAWDAKLQDAFAGPYAKDVLAPAGLGVLFGPSVYRGRPLEKLVDRYLDDALIAAVARENAKGRRLLIATTDLDRQETVIWNLGAIAAKGGPKARRLFRDVLVASASIPGVFPPKMIEVEAAGAHYSEMHVDGGVTAPFFSVPPGALYWTEPSGVFHRARLFVIMNGRLEPIVQSTSVNTVAVLARSFDAIELTAAHTTLAETEDFCRRNGVELKAAAMPRDVLSDGPFNFAVKSRRKLFDQGERLGESGEAWTAWKSKPGG